MCKVPPFTVTLVLSILAALSWLPPNTELSAGNNFSPPFHFTKAPATPSVLASTVTGVPLAKSALFSSS